MRRIGPLLVVSLTLVILGPLASPAQGAAADIYLKIPSINGEPQYDCNDQGCGIDVKSYSFGSQDGTCVLNCTGWPTDPTSVSLFFSVTRVQKTDRCKMKTGTGTLDLQWPNDPATPVAQGTFVFKSRDSKTVVFSGQITSSTAAALSPSDPLLGSITFPPNPCTGGTAAASIRFG
jgi:hypothetical protein